MADNHDDKKESLAEQVDAALQAFRNGDAEPFEHLIAQGRRDEPRIVVQLLKLKLLVEQGGHADSDTSP